MSDGAVERLTGYPCDDILYQDCRFLQGTDRAQLGLQAILLDQPGQFGLVVDAHRPAHGDDQVAASRVGQARIRLVETRVVQCGAARLEPVGHAADTFERHVLQYLYMHVQRHCCKVSDEAAFCLIQRPYISKT
ncbi:hypothetical protein FD815_28605, partial [Klebsiella pneumoniae]|nr:hypothetical protein [Klebsiella pneumoniae]